MKPLFQYQWHYFLKCTYYVSFFCNLICIVLIWYFLSSSTEITVSFNSVGHARCVINHEEWSLYCIEMTFALFVFFFTFIAIEKSCMFFATFVNFPRSHFWKSSNTLPTLRSMMQSFTFEMGTVFMLFYISIVMCFTLIPNLRKPPQSGIELNLCMAAILLIAPIYPLRVLYFWYFAKQR